jgi:hypothetical protein
MASHSRRPAAKDYFNPTEQIELLQSIKAKIEKSVATTPKESQFSHVDTTNLPNAGKPVDYKAHELSLREKLEKAKADREAKAKAEAALKAQTTTTTTDSPKPKVGEDQTSTEAVASGPPPPPVLNNTPTSIPPVPAFTPTWNPNLTYPNAIPSYGRPPYSYAQPFPQQFGMPTPYPNGQPAQTYPQWGQYPTTANTPGIPPPPPQPNQGPPTNQSPPNSVPANQSHPGFH